MDANIKEHYDLLTAKMKTLCPMAKSINRRTYWKNIFLHLMEGGPPEQRPCPSENNNLSGTYVPLVVSKTTCQIVNCCIIISYLR
jgi:hypothetical protein